MKANDEQCCKYGTPNHINLPTQRLHDFEIDGNLSIQRPEWSGSKTAVEVDQHLV
jgi:hypothetical protein